jgi:formylglycine-generating enzyme required for sulfatase activity
VLTFAGRSAANLLAMAATIIGPWSRSGDIEERGLMKIRREAVLLAWALLTTLVSVHAWASPARVALVIGNGQYEKSPSLRNPVNDAADMAVKLRTLGFTLVGEGPQLNVNRARMLKLLKDFRGAVHGGDVALLFYAGHGVAFGGDNWLLPVDDREIDAQEDVPDYSVSARSVIAQLEQRQGGTNIVILDACRDNPLPDRGEGGRHRSVGTRGLQALLSVPAETVVLYAAGYGEAALDGSGRNGLFTGELLKHLGQPGLRIEDVYGQTRKGVMNLSQGKQKPVEESTLTEPFYFIQGPPQGPPARVAALGSSSSRPEVAPSPGSVVSRPEADGLHIRACPECPEMVSIPSGEFTMGSPPTEKDRDVWEGPQHRVHVGSFEAAKYPVTVGEWRIYADEAGYKTTSGCDWVKFAQGDNHPVTCMSWQEAQDYIVWLNRKSGQHYRLLTEAEWEYAARAGTTTPYYWGVEIGREHANCNGCGSHWDNKQTSPVGSFAANPWGLFDMAGDVWEYTQDCWHSNYNGAPIDGSAWEAGACPDRVVRGGAWYAYTKDLRSACRTGGSGLMSVGLRLARTP